MRFKVWVCWGIGLTCLMSCNDSKSSEKPELKKTDQSNTQQQELVDKTVQQNELSFDVYSTGEGFGYSISSNNKKLIIQDHIPGIQGNQAFRSHEDATKVAELMIGKLENNIMPPSVTIEEMEQLGIEMN